jgi:type I restriction enzyme S subunit
MAGRDVRRRMKLGEILTEDRERVDVDPAGLYPIAGVYGFGRGVLMRDDVTGSEISAKHLYRLRAGQIMYSRLKAFEGAFALVPSEADGRFVSNEFPTFTVDVDQAVPEYVALVLRAPATWEGLAARITGMGARRERLQVDEFLSYEIELPSLNEQMRHVSQVDAADRAVSAARAEADTARVLALAMYRDRTQRHDWRRVPLREVMSLDISKVAVIPDAEYAIAGVLIAGRGLFRRPSIHGADTTYERLHQLRAEQLVYRKLTAWEGPITVVPAEFDGAFVSPEFPTFTLDQNRLLPEFMRFVCQMPAFHNEMKSRSKGTAERRGRLNPADLLEIEIDLPTLDDQRRVAAASAVAFAADAQAERAGAIASELPARLLRTTREPLAA